ncbi:hypothetical protein JO379_006423 [Streptomyces syringium]|uniref:Twin-arginine translocation signal domain-containing protein n=1 Tax=Streptomyces syringium TaxID=76729 RepID=A0ABS4YE09_9ACTN|nr:hypothetical protein [Streptomyces syringium]
MGDTVQSKGINRAQFLARAAAVGVAATSGAFLAPGRAGAEGRTAEPEPRVGNGPGLTHRGVCYEVGAGETPQTGWSAARMREDLRVIKDELHAGSITVFGDGIDRLAATSREAAERGLHIWLQPRLGDRPEREILDHLAETGRHAERLRRQGARSISVSAASSRCTCRASSPGTTSWSGSRTCSAGSSTLS